MRIRRGTALFFCQLTCLLLAGATLLACEKTSWKEVSRLPRDFRCGAALAVGPAEGFVAGRIRATEGKRFVTKEALIFRVRGKRVEQVFSRPNAGVFSLSAYAGTYWALLRVLDSEGGAGKATVLLASADEGASWQEIGAIPGHAYRLLATGESRLWVLGRDTLLYSQDRGESWTRVDAPGKRNSAAERLAIIDERHVGIIGNGIRLLDRESARYVRHILPGMEIAAADGRFIVAYENRRARIGLLDESLSKVRWLGTIDKKAHPFDISVSGQRMWVLALPDHDPLPLRGVHLFTSKNGGRSWSESRVRSAAWYEDVDLGPDGAGIGVGYENEVWLASP